MMSISTVAILWIVIGDDMRWRFPADRRCHASFFAGGDDAVPPQRRNIECVTRFQIGLKPWQAFRRQRVKGEGLVVIIFLEKDMADVRVQRIAHIQQPDRHGAFDLAHQGFVPGMVMPRRARAAEKDDAV